MAQRTSQKTWAVRGTDAGIHISEVGDNDPGQQLLTYEQAKAQVLAMLRDQVAPYLERISELQADHDLEAGALPTSKAWVTSGSQSCARMVIIAPTKAKAIEFSMQSRYSFNQCYSLAKGDWWCHLAHHGDGMWIEEQDEHHKGTGVFYQPVDRNESDRILEDALSPYRTMPIARLVAMKGHSTTSTGVSALGTPFKLIVSVTPSDWEADKVVVGAEVDDCLGWWASKRSFAVSRDIKSSAVDWKSDGF